MLITAPPLTLVCSLCAARLSFCSCSLNTKLLDGILGLGEASALLLQFGSLACRVSALDKESPASLSSSVTRDGELGDESLVEIVGQRPDELGVDDSGQIVNDALRF